MMTRVVVVRVRTLRPFANTCFTQQPQSSPGSKPAEFVETPPIVALTRSISRRFHRQPGTYCPLSSHGQSAPAIANPGSHGGFGGTSSVELTLSISRIFKKSREWLQPPICVPTSRDWGQSRSIPMRQLKAATGNAHFSPSPFLPITNQYAHEGGAPSSRSVARSRWHRFTLCTAAG